MGVFKRLFGKEDASWQTGASVTRTTTNLTVPPVVTGDVKTVTLTGDEARQAMQGMEAMTGMDLDGDGKVGAGPNAPAATPLSSIFTAAGRAPADDVVSQLERLAKLRDSGALTEAEFAAQKAKLLQQP